MLQRCTQKARGAIYYALRDAHAAGQDTVGSAEILIGLLQDRTHAAAHMLTDLGMPPAEIEPGVRQRIRPRNDVPPAAEPLDLSDNVEAASAINLAPGGRRTMEVAWEEAQQLGCTYVGTEHLLIALVSDKRLLPGRILQELGLDLQMARESAAKWLGADTNPPTQLEAPVSKAR